MQILSKCLAKKWFGCVLLYVCVFAHVFMHICMRVGFVFFFKSRVSTQIVDSFKYMDLCDELCSSEQLAGWRPAGRLAWQKL